MDAADAMRVQLRANRAGSATGIASVCSAHEFVIETVLRRAAARQSLVLIEATCNQVNQDGGYTGLDPAGFSDRVHAAADRAGLRSSALCLGGDHLGPNPWRDRPAAEAMAQATELVAAYAAAGFSKLHLDASMACADDSEPLSPKTIASRAAVLCEAAEFAAREAAVEPPLYVVGTEVPTPGGATQALDHIAVTRPHDLRATLDLHRAAFAERGLGAAFGRVIGVVVQPGVEFADTEIYDFDPAGAHPLSEALAGLGPEFDGLVFEAHSTDYQSEAALRSMVAGHFAILKVGPELTFAMREAVFALDAIESELLPAERRAGLRAALEMAMLDEPRWWRGHYRGDAAAQRLARSYSLSDRIRYYWGAPGVVAALDRLLANLPTGAIPATLISQYLPAEYAAIRAGTLPLAPQALIRHRIGAVLARYAAACGEA